MSFATNYVKEWNRIISNWFQNKDSISSLLYGKLSIDHIPEPFYGNMEECSIVIINLNPGVGLPEQCWSNQNQQGLFVTDVKNINSYSNYVKDFPLLPDEQKGYPKGPQPAIDWWKQRRLKWINRILCNMGIKTDKKPFAIELCPLHSKKFEIDASQYHHNLKTANPKLDVIEAMIFAIKASDAKIGLAIGKPIYKVLTDEGFEDITQVTDIKPINGNCREYHIVEKDGVRVLCTWARGGNWAPREEFGEYEKRILKKYK